MQNEPRRSTESNFITLLNFIVEPAVIVDQKGKFLIVNDAFIDLTGLSKKELIGTSFLNAEILTVESKATLLKNLKKRMQGLPVDPYEVSFRDKTGKVRYVEVKAKKIDRAGQSADLVIFRDITRRKENVRRLKEYSEKMEALVNEKVKEIEESETNYRAIINAMNDTAWVIDFDCKFIDVNDAAVKVLGYSREELLSMKVFDIDFTLVPEKIKALIKGMPRDEIQVFETAHTTKDGKTIPVEISSSLVTYQGKKAILSIARDITERKRMEERLLESEERLRNLYENIPDSLCVFVGREGHLLEYNKAFKKRTGYTDEELKDKTFLDFVYPDDRAIILKKYRKRYPKEEPPLVFEMRDVNKKGEALPTEVSVSTYKKKDRVIGIEVLHRDITERKKMEDELKQERDMLEAVTENIGAGLVVISKDYRILWANKLLKQINGDCEGKICYSTLNNLTDVCPDCGVKKVFENGVPIDTHEYSTIDDRGNTVWIELIATPIKDDKGNIAAVLELRVNITERKTMQNKLAEYSQKLEKLVEKRTEQLKQTQAKLVKSERLAAIGELAAMVGHDLRNPLTGIMGAAYYLKTKHGAELGAKGKEILETIERAINHSNRIVNDLLEYSRELKLEFTKTTPKALLQSTLAFLEIPRGIRIIDATEDKPKVKADKEKMLRVFANIIKNAIDALPEGGTLKIKSKALKGRLIITFKDSGTGMSEETLRNLWTPLFTTKAKGMGFGLPICRRIAEAHGGKLSVESKIGKGTKVTVTIPINPKPVNEDEEKWIFSESMLSTITTTQETH